MNSSASGFTLEVAEEVVSLSLEDLTDVQLQRAKHVVLDWLTVAIAGSTDPSATIVQRLAVEDACAPAAAIVGTGLRTSVGHAAFANAVAAHALDFDDTSWWAGGHPGAAVVAAALACGESADASGRAVLEAIVGGLQGQARINLAGIFHTKGFDGTGLQSAFGGAGACARILGFDAGATARTLGLAATQASGLMTGLGQMANQVNPGHAAAVAVGSARLVAAGFTGPIDVLESPAGFMASYSDSFDPRRADETMGDRLAVENVAFKRHACAGGTHLTIENVEALRTARGFSSEQVREVRVLSAPDMVKVCGVAQPTTGTEAKFSMVYGAALALAGRSTGPESFSDEAITDPDVAEAKRRVTVVPQPDRSVGTMAVEIDLLDGTTLASELGPVLSPVADDALDTEWEALVDKLETRAAPVVGAAAASELLAAVASLESVGSIRDVLSPAVRA